MKCSLACLTNLARRGTNISANYAFCREIQTTKHVVSGCFSCLNRYTWRQDSVLINLANFLQPIAKKLCCDLSSFLPVGILTGTAIRPDLILIERKNDMFMEALTVSHESIAKSDAARKATKCKHLLKDEEITGAYNKINFVNPVMTPIGIYSAHGEPFFTVLKSFGIGISTSIPVKLLFV